MDFRSWIFENWGIKILSLGLSLTLWFYVTSTGKTELTLSIPIELRNIPAGMVVVGDVAGSLDVRMQGQERVLREGIINKKVFAVLDLAMTREGENVIRLSPDDINRPGGAIVTHLSQSAVKVKLEPLVRKSLRLKPILRGVPASGYRLTSTTVTPSRIMLEGPASVMKMLRTIETMPIDIQQANQSVTVEPRIDYQGKPVKLIEKNIAVRVTIERAGR
jgi:YbbR domain-containing protein